MKCHHDLPTVDGSTLGKNILHINRYDTVDSVHTGHHRQVCSALFLSMEKWPVTFSSVGHLARRKRRPITIPPSSSARGLLNNVSVRECITCWLGVCGLRIGGAPTVTYNDVSVDWIDTWGHVVDGAMHEGLKRGVGRRVRMPRGLFALLDKSEFSTSEPLICNQFTGACFVTSYGTQGVLVGILSDYGIE